MGAGIFTIILVIVQLAECVRSFEVPFVPVRDEWERRAVCLDGSPAGYQFASGYGDGANNWIVYLKGGGFCQNYEDCIEKSTTPKGSTLETNTVNLTGMLSQSQYINPDFYNWNRAYVIYCDQASFLGDTQLDGPGWQLQFRGSKIFDAVIEDLLVQGLGRADNAILAGRSAGGLATILHCDNFRARLPNVHRVKCISDAGFFIRTKNLPNADFREGFFASIINFHGIESFLPLSCRSIMDPTLCFFGEYLIGDVQTPLFLVNSAFDLIQIKNLLGTNVTNFTPSQKKVIKEYGRTFLSTIKDIPYNPLRGMFIHSCFAHTTTTSGEDNQSTIDAYWNPKSNVKIENMTMIQAVSKWFFDRGTVNLIGVTDLPLYCN